MIDANQLPITEEKDDAILAKKLQMFTTSPLYIKHSKSRIPLSSQIYALKKNSAEINKNLNLWFKTEEYTALHHLFSQKEELTDSHKRLHLLKASQKGDLSTINALLKNGVNLNTSEMHYPLPLYLAAQNNHLKVIKKLIAKGSDINLPNNPKKFTALCVAAATGRLTLVNTLLFHGAKIDLSYNGSTPLGI